MASAVLKRRVRCLAAEVLKFADGYGDNVRVRGDVGAIVWGRHVAPLNEKGEQ